MLSGRIGGPVQGAGGLLLFAAAAASDAGLLPATGLACCMVCAAALLAAGCRLRGRDGRERFTVIIPLSERDVQ